MIFYLDVSALNRPFDDQSQTRIRLESEAVMIILERVDKGIYGHVSSEMARIEIGAIRNAELRRRISALLPENSGIIPLDDAIFDRAKMLQPWGFKAADAVHIAAAEAAQADVLLSCDDQMCSTAHRNAKLLEVKVANPLQWLQENPDDEDTREQVRDQGIAALRDKLGRAGMIRFLQQFESGSGDYARQRRSWVNRTSLESIQNSARMNKSRRAGK